MTSPRRGQLRGIHVLVVEDDPDSRFLLEQVLKCAGARVTAAEDAYVALSLLEDLDGGLEEDPKLPDVLISDIAMPGMDGLTLMKRFRQMPVSQLKHVPTIALSAFAGPDDLARTFEAGFDEHMAKPANFDGLIAVIGRLLASFAPSRLCRPTG